MATANLNYGLDKIFPLFMEYAEEEEDKPLNISQLKDFLDKKEGYKYDLFKKAQEQLNVDSWTEDMVDSGQIFHKVKSAVIESDNLVDWRLIDKKFSDEAIKKYDLSSYEKTFYDFYTDKVKDSKSFDDLVDIFGGNYPLLAYLFFIKDKDKYCVISPKKFDRVFDLLFLNFKTSGYASWGNYKTYCQIIAETRDYLQKKDSDITLTDAHSFLWLFGEKYFVDKSDKVKEKISGRPSPEEDVRHVEGYARSMEITVYERDPKARRKCIDHFGYDCQICGFNFEAEYGELGKDFIQVHHIKPMSQSDGEREVDPINDLIPVCPNCHALIHRKGDPDENLENLKVFYGC